MQYLVIGFALISAVLIRAAPSETEIGTVQWLLIITGMSLLGVAVHNALIKNLTKGWETETGHVQGDRAWSR